jgi:uncharacterized membrane protein
MSDLTGHTDRERRGETGRVTAFTDGVFAIIITILVLDIAVPAGLPDQSLAEAVDETWSELAAWVVSFLLTGMYWVWHRDLFNQVRVVDRGAVWLNLLFLVPVSLLPFGASVLSEYPTDAIGLRVYGTVLVVTVVMRWVLYAYLMHRAELLWSAPTRRQRRVGASLALAPVGIYALAMLVAGVAPSVSLVLYFSVPLLYFLLITALRRRPSTRTEAEDFA